MSSGLLALLTPGPRECQTVRFLFISTCKPKDLGVNPHSGKTTYLMIYNLDERYFF